MPWHRPLRPASVESRTRHVPAPGEARFLSRQKSVDDFVRRILLLARLLRLLYFFICLFFLWGLGRFFFGGFLCFLTFAHDFLRFEVAIPPCLIEHLVTGNPVGFPWRRQSRRIVRGQTTNIQQLHRLKQRFRRKCSIRPWHATTTARSAAAKWQELRPRKHQPPALRHPSSRPRPGQIGLQPGHV